MTSDGDKTKPTVEIFFQPDCTSVTVPEGTPLYKAVTVPEGTPLYKAAAIAGCAIEAPCGGLGVCGKCRIKLISPLSAPDKDELRMLSTEEIEAGFRLACKTKARGPKMEIEIPSESRSLVQKILSTGALRSVKPKPNVSKTHIKVEPPSLQDERGEYERLVEACVCEGEAPPRLEMIKDLSSKLRRNNYDVTMVRIGNGLVDVEPGNTEDDCYGIAYDLGSTTIVGYLFHLPTAREVAVASTMNPQMQHGDDLVSRIKYANENQEGRKVLQQAALGALNDILHHVTRDAGVRESNVYEATVVGNTCMTHLLLGIDPSSLGISPYVPTICRPLDVPSSILGLKINARGSVHILPNVAGFVGSDLVGVLLASMWQDDGKTRLAVDIGTNGEMALRHNGSTFACSAAAGPAFEGAGISYGMRARAGAIDSVTIDEDVKISTIQHQRPRGICGSGLIDAIAAMLQAGVIDETGRMADPEELAGVPELVRKRIIEVDGQKQFVLSWDKESYSGKNIAITQKDVRQVQLAKGSIHAAIRTMLHLAGTSPEELDEILLAGAFGSYIRVESALRIGLIPDVPRESVKSIGNAAGSGSRLALLSLEERKRACEIARSIHHIELANHNTYQEEFTERMLFPIAK